MENEKKVEAGNVVKTLCLLTGIALYNMSEGAVQG